MKLIIFGTAWITLTVIAYLLMGFWCGQQFGPDPLVTWFILGIVPTAIIGAAPFALYMLQED